MLHVVLADRTIDEVANAVTGAVEGTALVCRNAAGDVVKTYQRTKVLMFGNLDDFINQDDESPNSRGKPARYVVRAEFTGVLIATYEIKGDQREMIEALVERRRSRGDIVTKE